MPVRTCVGCRRKAPQPELVRVVRGPDGSLLVGRELPGRGAWICRGGTDCMRVAAKKRAFGRALRAPVSEAAVLALARRLGAPLEPPPSGS